MDSDKIVVISPTEAEIEPFLRHPRAAAVETAVCGVGMAETARAVAEILSRGAVGIIVLAGIAGRYPHSPLAVGEVAIVGSERVADLGAVRREGFRPLYPKVYECPHVAAFGGFRVAAANTVSAAAAPFAARGGVDIENMEGAAFFASCMGAGVPFVELRAVSNTVGDPLGMWSVPLATGNLAAALDALISSL